MYCWDEVVFLVYCHAQVENEELMRIRNDYLPLLVKCSNHIGLLLPSLTASNQQNVKVNILF